MDSPSRNWGLSRKDSIRTVSNNLMSRAVTLNETITVTPSSRWDGGPQASSTLSDAPATSSFLELLKSAPGRLSEDSPASPTPSPYVTRVPYQ